jgi:hypothetical protein
VEHTAARGDTCVIPNGRCGPTTGAEEPGAALGLYFILGGHVGRGFGGAGAAEDCHFDVDVILGLAVGVLLCSLRKKDGRVVRRILY